GWPFALVSFHVDNVTFAKSASPLLALKRVPDLSKQLHLLGRLRLLLRFRLGLFLALKRTHYLDGDEDTDGDDGEVDDGLEKDSVSHDRAADRDGQVSEVYSSGRHSRQRHDDVVSQRGHYLAESAADNDR